MGGGSIGGRLSLVRRFSFRKNKGSSSAKSPYKMAKLTIQKRSSSTPFESSFFVKPKPERRLSSLLPRRKSNKGSDSTFSMDSILQRALMPPGLDEATRMIFNSSNSSSKQRRNAVFEMNNEERNGLKVFLREHIKSKQPKEWKQIRVEFLNDKTPELRISFLGAFKENQSKSKWWGGKVFDGFFFLCQQIKSKRTKLISCYMINIKKIDEWPNI